MLAVDVGHFVQVSSKGYGNFPDHFVSNEYLLSKVGICMIEWSFGAILPVLYAKTLK